MSGAPALKASVEAAVKRALLDVDGSHDFSHIDRVRALSLRLAASEGISDAATLCAIELGALLHDTADWKYSGSDAANHAAASRILSEAGADGSLLSRVLAIVDGVGFSSELAGGGTELPLECAIVQDAGEMWVGKRAERKGKGECVCGALTPPLRPNLPLNTADRLDAIGAIGIARCFTFGGAKGRVLHDPSVVPLDPAKMTKEEYRSASRIHTTLNHFPEKLLTLREKMKTSSGRELAETRHVVMQSFLEAFHMEWIGVR